MAQPNQGRIDPRDVDLGMAAEGVNPMTAAMAQMILGPILADEDTRNGVRDTVARALEDAGVVGIELYFSDGAGDGVIAEYGTLAPYQAIEIFLSRLAAEFGFSIPDYLTLADVKN